jgi:tRNA pseudouridine38-40 synthase
MTGTQMQNWKLSLAYNGKEFFGFQSQPNGNTVQDHLEKALTTALRSETKVVGGSRTDSGVHAENQVCMFKSDEQLDPRKLIRTLNALLPADIKVYDLSKASEDFHPMGSSKGKIYRYRLWKGFCLDPFAISHVWEVNPDLDIAELENTMREFIGRHDFCSLSNSGSSVKTTVRNVIDIQIVSSGSLIDVWVHGEGFLKQMVRNMVGTAVDITLGKLELSIPSILEAKDRKAAGRTAPGNGLTLVRSNFEGDSESIEDQIDRAKSGFTSAVFA